MGRGDSAERGSGDVSDDGMPEVDIDELERQRASGAAVFDVREPWEHQQERIPGAIPIPLDAVLDATDRFREAAAGRPVYVVCAAGGRSAQAVGYLRSCGIDAVNVAGGTDAWAEAGKPVETGVPRHGC